MLREFEPANVQSTWDKHDSSTCFRTQAYRADRAYNKTEGNKKEEKVVYLYLFDGKLRTCDCLCYVLHFI